MILANYHCFSLIFTVFGCFMIIVSVIFKILPLDSPLQDVSYGVIYFSVARIFIDFDKLIVWYYIPRCIFGNENSNWDSWAKPKPKPKFWPNFSPNFSSIYLKSFDVLWCCGLKTVFNKFFITQLEKMKCGWLFN